MTRGKVPLAPEPVENGQSWVAVAALTALCLAVIVTTLALSLAAGRLYAFATGLSSLAVAGTVVLIAALMGLVLRYASRMPKRGAIVVRALMPFLAICSFTLAYGAYSTSPPYIIESLAITASVADLLGTTGHAEAHIQSRVLHNSLSLIEWGPLGATGDIKNVEFNALGLKLDSGVRTENGQEFAFIKLGDGVKRGQRLNLLLDFDIVNSKSEDIVYWTHDVSFPTENLQIGLVVPSERPCKGVRAESQPIAGGEIRFEVPPFLTDRGTRVTWAKANPDNGRRYTVLCNW